MQFIVLAVVPGHRQVLNAFETKLMLPVANSYRDYTDRIDDFREKRADLVSRMETLRKDRDECWSLLDVVAASKKRQRIVGDDDEHEDGERPRRRRRRSSSRRRRRKRRREPHGEGDDDLGSASSDEGEGGGGCSSVESDTSSSERSGSLSHPPPVGIVLARSVCFVDVVFLFRVVGGADGSSLSRKTQESAGGGLYPQMLSEYCTLTFLCQYGLYHHVSMGIDCGESPHFGT